MKCLFHLGTGTTSLTVRKMKHWKRDSRRTWKSASLAVSKTLLDKVLSSLIYLCSLPCFEPGSRLDDFSGTFQTTLFCYIHKIFCDLSLTSLERKKGNTLCMNISDYIKVNIYICTKIITRVYRFPEGIMKSCLKFSLEIQTQHTNLLCALYSLEERSS